MDHRLTDFKVLTFDCYATLIDWETGIWDALQPLLMQNAGESVTRATALEAFASIEPIGSSNARIPTFFSMMEMAEAVENR
jgi:FMN phosphatase YigB (HAD superfamily)